MRVLVCGGRDYADYAKMESILDEYNIDLIIHGGARGADSLAGLYAYYKNIAVQKYEADWYSYGKKAGFIRNQRMLDEGKPELVIAFPGGAGTADMINRAQTQGFKVEIIK